MEVGPLSVMQWRQSCPAEARAWNCAVSESAEIAAHSRFQAIKRAALTGGPSFFTTRGKRGDDMDEKDDKIAHLLIITKPGIAWD
jgi:hypothetical protein